MRVPHLACKCSSSFSRVLWYRRYGICRVYGTVHHYPPHDIPSPSFREVTCDVSSIWIGEKEVRELRCGRACVTRVQLRSRPEWQVCFSFLSFIPCCRSLKSGVLLVFRRITCLIRIEPVFWTRWRMRQTANCSKLL